MNNPAICINTDNLIALMWKIQREVIIAELKQSTNEHPVIIGAEPIEHVSERDDGAAEMDLIRETEHGAA